MPLRDRFPAASRLWSALTSRLAKTLAVALIAIFLALNLWARVSIWLAARRMQAVVVALGKLEIDKTTEEELARTVPQLVKYPWEGQVQRRPEIGAVDLGVVRAYHLSFSNETTWMKYARIIRTLGFCSAEAKLTKDGYEEGCIHFVPDLLGYRYYSFDASVGLLNGKVSSIRYGINDRFVAPRALGAIVSVRSFHSIWRSHQIGFQVDSLQDENPELRISANEHRLSVEYAYDAPRETVKDAFQINLNCFWSLRGCLSSQQIAPRLWQASEATERTVISRLQSAEPCPARIVSGRIRYLPDAGVTLAKSKGFKQVPTNIEGEAGVETLNDFEQLEVIRPPQVASLMGVRPRAWAGGDYKNQVLHGGQLWPEAGKKVLFFSNIHFDSCQLVPADSLAISTAKNTKLAPRREEDETGLSLQ